MTPTARQIVAEITALEDCLTFIPSHAKFGDDNHAIVRLQIEYLKGEIDTSAGEFGDMALWQQSAVIEAEAWADGQCDEAPSAGWQIYRRKRK